MTSETRRAVLLQFASTLKEAGSWCGETHLQKAVYFLQELTGVPLGFRYTLYKHGPFSFELKDQLGEFVGYGLMTVQPNEPPYGPTLLVTDRGLKLADADQEAKSGCRAICFVADRLAGKGVVELERLSTALLLAAEGVAVEGRAMRLVELKPHISVEQAGEAVNQVEQWRGEWGL